MAWIYFQESAVTQSPSHTTSPTSRELLLDKNNVLAELAKREVWQTELLNRYWSVNAKKIAKNPRPSTDNFAQTNSLDLCSRPMVCFRAIITTIRSENSTKTNLSKKCLSNQ